MKKVDIRLAAAVLLIFAIAISLLGCSVQEKMAVLDSLEKMAEIKSMESAGDIWVRIGVTGLSEEERAPLEDLLQMMRGINFKFHQKYNEANKGKTTNSQIDTVIKAGGETFSTSIWTKTDISNKKPVIKQIIRPPSMLMELLPPQFAGKSYIIMDEKDIFGNQEYSKDDYDEVVESMSKYQAKLMNFLKEYAVKFDPGFAIITYKGNAAVNGQNLKMYELRITDASFKKLIRYTVDNLSKNENAKRMLKELVASMAMLPEEAAPGSEVDTALDEFRDGTTTFKEDIYRLLDAFEGVRFLGERGIVANLGINEDGYIVKQDGYADFIFNMKQIENALTRAAGGEVGNGEGNEVIPEATFTVSIDFDTDIFNINQDVNIIYPDVNAQNSFNLRDLMLSIEPDPNITDNEEPAGPEVIINGKQVNITPVVLDDLTLVPAEDIAAELGAAASRENGVLTIVRNGTTVVFHIDDVKARVNGREITIDFPATDYEDKTYVPLRFLVESLGAEVLYDKAGHIVINSN